MSKNTYTFPQKLLESDNSGLSYKPERWLHYFWNTLYLKRIVLTLGTRQLLDLLALGTAEKLSMKKLDETLTV